MNDNCNARPQKNLLTIMIFYIYVNIICMLHKIIFNMYNNFENGIHNYNFYRNITCTIIYEYVIKLLII